MNPVVVLRTLFDSAWNTSKGMDTNYSLILIHANYASVVRYLADHLLAHYVLSVANGSRREARK
jgi:uncharacterized linocin/CFP29 family protein